MGLTNTEICEGPEGPSGWAKPGTLAKRWITVQLPAGERFTRKALDWHGKKGTSLDDSACEQGSFMFRRCATALAQLSCGSRRFARYA